MYINNLGTFDAVAAHYNSIRPLKSKNYSLEQDLRPIGDRVNPWGMTQYVQGDDSITDEEVMFCAPILWQRHPDGTETVTIRNGAGDWQNTGNHMFLSRAVPRGLWFLRNRNGEHFIRVWSDAGHKEHFLPRRRCIPRGIVKYYESQTGKWAKQFKGFMSEDDGNALVFRRIGVAQFALANTPPKHLRKAVHVQVDIKKEYAAHIKALRQWCNINMPLLAPTLTWQLKREHAVALDALANEHGYYAEGYQTAHGNDFFGLSDPGFVRSVLADPEHPLYFYLGFDAIVHMHDAVTGWRFRERSVELDGEELQKARQDTLNAAFRKWSNRVLGFNKQVKVEVQNQ